MRRSIGRIIEFSFGVIATSLIVAGAYAQEICCRQPDNSLALSTPDECAIQNGTVIPRFQCVLVDSAVSPFDQPGVVAVIRQPPSEPLDIRVTTLPGEAGKVRISARIGSNGGASVTGYSVYRGRGDRIFTYGMLPPQFEHTPPPNTGAGFMVPVDLLPGGLDTLADDSLGSGEGSNRVWTRQEGELPTPLNDGDEFSIVVDSMEHSTDYCFALQVRNVHGYSAIPSSLACGETAKRCSNQILFR